MRNEGEKVKEKTERREERERGMEKRKGGGIDKQGEEWRKGTKEKERII